MACIFVVVSQAAAHNPLSKCRKSRKIGRLMIAYALGLGKLWKTGKSPLTNWPSSIVAHCVWYVPQANAPFWPKV